MLRSLISFLTIIPAGGSDLESAARRIYLFPIVGAIIGVITGSLGLVAWSLGLDPLIVGVAVASVTAIITGMHHIDGLADFADGLMTKGTKERKLSSMKDHSVGSAGITAIILCYVGFVAALSAGEGFGLFVAIFLAEIVAKFSMVLAAFVGRPASQGSGSVFLSVTNWKSMSIAASLTISPVLLLGGAAGFAMLGAGAAATLLIAIISARSFGGMTGDVLGAINETARLVSIMVFISI